MDEPLTVVDVGARWGVADRWAELAPNLRIYGFDPDPEECGRLNAAAMAAGDTTTTYIPLALGSNNGSEVLYLTRSPGCSSIYPPMSILAGRLPELACIMPIGTSEVTITTLDSWCRANNVTTVDAMKLDTQGSELGVLQGAEHTLQTVQLLEIEVEFNPTYHGQPLFGDVDAYLRARGFLLWRLDNLVHYSAGDEVGRVERHAISYFDSVPFSAVGRGGQLFWGHAYYTRAELCPGTEVSPSRGQAERAAAIARAAGLPDLALSAMIASGAMSPPVASVHGGSRVVRRGVRRAAGRLARGVRRAAAGFSRRDDDPPQR